MSAEPRPRSSWSVLRAALRASRRPERRDPCTVLHDLGLGEAKVEVLDTGWGNQQWVFLVKHGRRAMVLKLLPCSTLGTRLRRALALQAESRIYLALQTQQWCAFRHPRLLSTDAETYLLIDFVEHGSEWPPDIVRRVIDGLVEFQTSLPEMRQPAVWHMLQALRPTAPWRILVASSLQGVRSKSWKLMSACLRLYLRCRWRIARSACPRLVQHGDFTYANVVVGSDGVPHFIDFQRAASNQRLVFRDAVQLATDISSEHHFDPATLRTYIELWCDRLGLSMSSASWQLRTALLLQALYVAYCYPVADHDAKHRYRRFLECVILPDDAYSAWQSSVLARGRG